MRDLPKNYEPSAVESEAYRVWLEEKCFHADPTAGGDAYAIVIPPPNVTAALHLGHALNNTIQDILIRQHRMRANNTVWLPGTDHAGIATQTVVEKRVLAEEGKRRTDFARDEFVARIQAWKDEYEQRITEQLKAMGCSCDWDRQAFTMDPARALAVREAFFRLFKDGLIYRGKRLVNWDPVTQTALADDEVEMEEVDGHFYYMRYPLADGTGHVTVATTRPETMLGDTAVAVNPKDARASELRGKFVLLPIVNRKIPIIEDDYVVLADANSEDAKAKYASGFLKVTPAHDPNDWEIGLRHKLEAINVMGPDASISDKYGWKDIGDAGFLLGKSREEARKLIVDWFKKNGLLEEIKSYRHSVGHSYRSHVPIEPWLSDQWYCRVTDPRLAGAALKAMDPEQRANSKSQETGGTSEYAPLTPSPGTPGEGGGEGLFQSSAGGPSPQPSPGLPGEGANAKQGLRFYPARYAKTFQSWHENIRDWCISRQLWWGHRIPVWSLFSASQLSDTARNQLLKWTTEGFIAVHRKGISLDGTDDSKWTDDAWGNLVELFVSVRPNNPHAESWLEQNNFTQDPDVLDTWFSSGLWPMSTLNWPADTPDLREWNPSSVLCTAREIITLWVSRMVMFNLYFRDCLPFRDVFIHAMIQDGEGQKMSKSLGNGVDPLDIIHSHGADAMRFTLAAMTTHTQDLRMSVDLVDPHSGQAFAPAKITNSSGYVVAAPIQSSPADPKKKMVSSYGQISGAAKPTADMPVAKNTSSKFDLGRNFCNKLWNAGRFALSNLANVKLEPADASKWSLADQWIIGRLNRTIEEVDSALSQYRFDVYAKNCYDFFWRDLCDWYLEAIKPAMKDPKRAGQTANVLAAVMDGALRLMHPMIPFITETIWWQFNEVRPERTLAGQLELPPSKRLVSARWPEAGKSFEAETLFPKLQEIVGAIRNLRNAHQVDAKRSVGVTIVATSEVSGLIGTNREVIELLGICALKEVGPSVAAPASAARAQAAGCDIFIESLVDEVAEKQRVAKQCVDLQRQIAALRGRLTNDAYIAKAPPHLVQQTRDQLAAAESDFQKLGCGG